MGTIKIVVVVVVVVVVVKPVQSNLVILDTKGAIENVHINEVSIINRLNLQKMIVRTFSIDLVTVFDAILTRRQTREKLQFLYENPMLNDFRKTAVLEKI